MKKLLEFLGLLSMTIGIWYLNEGHDYCGSIIVILSGFLYVISEYYRDNPSQGV